MASGWTPERRARQAQAVQRWRPWEHSTGPRTADGKSRSARNADKGGEWRKLREMVKTLNQAMREHRRFEIACAPPVAPAGTFSPPRRVQENSELFQMHLPNELGTAPAV